MDVMAPNSLKRHTQDAHFWPGQDDEFLVSQGGKFLLQLMVAGQGFPDRKLLDCVKLLERTLNDLILKIVV